MRGALLILKKEFLELAKDRKTVFFTFVMPLILYPAIFGIIGTLTNRDRSQRESRPSRVVVTDASGTLKSLLESAPKDFKVVPAPSGDLKQAIRDQKVEMGLEVDGAAADKLTRQETFTVQATVDTSEDASRLAYTRLKDALQKQDTRWIQARLQAIHASEQLALPSRLEKADVSDAGLMLGKVLGAMLPYLIMMMMFAGAMQLGVYATAGEKERGTLQTLLATSLPRYQIILGKLLYVFSIGILGALVNILAMSLSMGKLFTNQASQAMASGSASAQAMASGSGLATLASPMNIALVFLLMVPLGLLFSNVILLAGVQAKSTQEATTAITPALLVVLVLGIFSMGPGIDKMGFLAYVPVINVSLAIRKLLAQQPYAFEFAVAFLMTVGLAAVASWLSTRLLNRESAIFRV